MAVQFEYANAAEIINEMVRRVVERFAPERVILFGSRATGEAAPDSDADLLVVMPCEVPPRDLAVEIRKALADLPLGKDVIVVTPEYFARYRDVIGTVVWSAVRDGKTLYVRAS